MQLSVKLLRGVADCDSVCCCFFSAGWCLRPDGDEPYSSDACSAGADQRRADVEQSVHREAVAQGNRRRCLQDLRTLGETQREPEPRGSL